MGDCLTAINGVPLDKSSGLREVMAAIRAAESPLSLRFARYAPRHVSRSSSSPSSSPSLTSSSVPAWASAAAGVVGRVLSPTAASARGGGGGVSGGLDSSAAGARAREGGVAAGVEKREAPVDPELDDVLNSALVLGLGERVAGIQKRNARLLQEVGRIGRAAADKRRVSRWSHRVASAEGS